MDKTLLVPRFLITALLLTSGAASAAPGPRTCDDPAVARYIQKAYKGAKPFASLRAESRDLVCSQVLDAYSRYRKTLPELKTKLAEIRRQYRTWEPEDKKGGPAETVAREALTGPVLLPGGRRPPRDAGSLNQFALAMAGLLPAVRFNVEDQPGEPEIAGPGPGDSPLDLPSLDRTAARARDFADDDAHAPGEHCASDMWAEVRVYAEKLGARSPVLLTVPKWANVDVSRLKVVREGGQGRDAVVLLSRAQRDELLFDAARRRDGLKDGGAPSGAVQGGTAGLENPFLAMLGGGSKDPAAVLTHPAPLKRRALDDVEIPATAPWSGGRKPASSVGLSEAVDRLILEYGGGKEALGAVIEARGGDANEVPYPARVQALERIRRVTGMDLKDPRSDASVDDDLMHLDHYLNTYAGGRASFAPSETDGWFKRKAKTLGRSTLALGGAVITTSYEGVKLFDQTTGLGAGKVVGYDFNAPNASRASLGGWWAGIRGSFVSAFDEEP